ncbi:MAG: hypothetical protein N3G21_02235 [Candidatus Hydrogenedentes bacterium]|nr:hypothetical protein [Candidatus Hydrogenedentota bacterium]
MILLKIWNGFKFLFLGLIFLTISITLWYIISDPYDSPLTNIIGIPNYNYIPDIKKLKEEGKLQEALELTRFVLRHPDMPGQEEAKALEKELETEINSLWGKAKRAAKGFITGSGNSIEELGGGIASDMIFWGDFRDLIKQGYFSFTGQETDPVISALAGIGLLTEVFDFADWAPAVLKAFRKVGALSKKFADFIIATAKSSSKIGKLDEGLKIVLKNLSGLVDKMGLARSATVMKHIDTAEDLASVAKIAEKNADTVYLMVKNGGPEGVSLLKQLGNTDEGIKVMNEAVKKGPAGIQWLKKGGSGRKYVIGTRFVARVIKNLRLERPQQFIKTLIANYPQLKMFFYIIIIISFIISLLAFFKSLMYFLSLFTPKKLRTTTASVN